jgi:hypothetical protein
MSSRIIKSRARGSSVHLPACRGSLFALELLKPSRELYLLSPRVSKVPLLDNRVGQFRVLAGHLGDILRLLAARGTQVRIVYRAPANEMTSRFHESVRAVEHIGARTPCTKRAWSPPTSLCTAP